MWVCDQYCRKSWLTLNMDFAVVRKLFFFFFLLVLWYLFILLLLPILLLYLLLLPLCHLTISLKINFVYSTEYLSSICQALQFFFISWRNFKKRKEKKVLLVESCQKCADCQWDNEPDFKLIRALTQLSWGAVWDELLTWDTSRFTVDVYTKKKKKIERENSLDKNLRFHVLSSFRAAVRPVRKRRERK